jgi:ATP-dependent protease ClpP protease subunit
MGEGLTAKRVEDELAALGEVDELNVLINSPGGVIYEALGIYNALARHSAKVTTYNVGAAWSCAGWILQAGDERVSAENATLMIHNSQGFVMGDRRDMAKEIEVLDKLDQTIAVTFSRRTGRKADTFRAMMDEESWFDGAESLAAKLVDRVEPAKSGAKNLDPKSYGFNRKAAPNVNEIEDAKKEAEEVLKSLEKGEITGNAAREKLGLPPLNVTPVDVRLRMLELEGA